MPKIVGKKVTLRDLSNEDIKDYSKHLEDMTGALNLGVWARYPNTIESINELFLANNNGESKQLILFTIESIDRKKFIGTISINIDFINRFGILGIVLDKDNRGKGYGKEAMILLINYIFNTFMLRNVYLQVVSSNLAGISAYKKVGFEIMGIQPKSDRGYDGYTDLLTMGLNAKIFYESIGKL